MKTELQILVLVTLLGVPLLLTTVEADCKAEDVSFCDRILYSDQSAAFTRDATKKCGVIRDYVQCLEGFKECTDATRDNLKIYLEKMRLRCSGVNYDDDVFQHGCHEPAMKNCEAQLQKLVSSMKEDSRDEEFVICTGTNWARLCMVENASCEENFADYGVEETKQFHGVKCSSHTSVPLTYLIFVALVFVALVNRTTDR